MEKKNFEGLTEVEIVRQINKKKKRYCAIALGELEEENLDEEEFKRIRKIFLDSVNNFTRGIFTVIGIDIDGIEES